MENTKSAVMFNDSSDLKTKKLSVEIAEDDPNIEVSRYRFVILAIYSANCCLNAFTFVVYTTITNSVAIFYDVDVSTVDWATLCYGIACSFPIIFATWFLERKNLKWAIMGSVLLGLVGNAIKCFSLQPDRFYLVLIGQTIAGFGQAFIYPVPAKLSSEWFPANEVSKASAVCVFSFQAMTGMPFLVATSIVHDVTDRQILMQDFKYLVYGLCAFNGLIAVVTLVGFKAKPPRPPSVALALQHRRRSSVIHDHRYLPTIKRLVKNRKFFIHIASYTLLATAFNSINVVIVQILWPLFPGRMQEIGYLGCYFFIIGIPGCLLSGIYIDKTHRYKELALFLNVVSLVSCAIFGIMSRTVHQINWLYIPITFLGMATVSFLSLGYELGSELTYPESTSIMACLLTVVGQCVTPVVVPVNNAVAELFHDKMDIFLMGVFCAMLLASLILTAFIKPDYRRQRVEKRRMTRVEQLSEL